MTFPHRHTALAALLFTLACGGSGDSAPTGPGVDTSTPASAYLTEVLDKMESLSIKRKTIDWPAFRASVHAAGASAQSIAETRDAIRTAITLLGDGHSSFTMASGAFIFVSNRTCIPSGATAPTLPENIGYIKVGAFSGNIAAANAFAEGIQASIASHDKADLIGWVVDLRGNGGGNMWPMVAGLGPIIGDGVMGHFIDPVGATSAWEYHDGASWSAGSRISWVSQPYPLLRANPRVAVLTDQGVASSGEATAVAFRGRANTRSFGASTCGLSTANRGMPMSDGGLLNLTVSTMADRNKILYGDVLVLHEVEAVQSQAVNKAVAWLQAGAAVR